MVDQFRSLDRSERTKETGGYGEREVDGVYWTGEDGDHYNGWKAKDGPELPMSWRRLTPANWLASIPAKHGSNFHRAALNAYDTAGCSISYIQWTTHQGAVQDLLSKLDPDVFRQYFPGWELRKDGRFDVLAKDGEVVDQVVFRHIDFVEALHKLALESDEFDAICRKALVQRLEATHRKFGTEFGANKTKLALAFDLWCNKGISGAYAIITGTRTGLTKRLKDWETCSAEELRDYMISVRIRSRDGKKFSPILSASRIRYTYSEAEKVNDGQAD